MYLVPSDFVILDTLKSAAIVEVSLHVGKEPGYETFVNNLSITTE